MFESWFSLPVGVLIATVVSTAGIGGGVLWMPFLLIILKLKPDTAVVTSLLIQTAGMGSGTLAFWRKGRIDFRLMAFALLFAIPGVGVGAYLTRMLAPVHLELILGCLTLVAALAFVSAQQNYGEAGYERAEITTVKRYGWAIGTMAVASGMLSVSIGEWLVPLLRSRFSLRMRVAIATSVATVFGTCVLALLFHGLMGARVDLPSLLWAVPGVIVGGQIGPRIAGRINDRILKELFIFLLTLIGIHLIYNSY